MKKAHNAEGIHAPGRFLKSGNARATSAEPLEVNVIFTDREATAAALKMTESLARGLGACIRLRAGIVVPVQLPLDRPPVSVGFFEKMLREVAGDAQPDGQERSIHLYLCRDWQDTLLGILKPNSVAVIGVRKRWWPSKERRLARVLRRRGFRVILEDSCKRQSARVPQGRMKLGWFLTVRTIARRFGAYSTHGRRRGYAR